MDNPSNNKNKNKNQTLPAKKVTRRGLTSSQKAARAQALSILQAGGEIAIRSEFSFLNSDASQNYPVLDLLFRHSLIQSLFKLFQRVKVVALSIHTSSPGLPGSTFVPILGPVLRVSPAGASYMTATTEADPTITGWVSTAAHLGSLNMDTLIISVGFHILFSDFQPSFLSSWLFPQVSSLPPWLAVLPGASAVVITVFESYNKPSWSLHHWFASEFFSSAYSKLPRLPSERGSGIARVGTIAPVYYYAFRTASEAALGLVRDRDWESEVRGVSHHYLATLPFWKNQ